MWIKLWVRGGADEETSFVFVPGEWQGESEDLKEVALAWASGTSIGTLRDMYGYGYEHVTELPDKVRDEMIAEYEGALRNATRMLDVLSKVPTIPCCRQYGCTDPTAGEAHVVGLGGKLEERPTPLCQRHLEANEARRAMYERHTRKRAGGTR